MHKTFWLLALLVAAFMPSAHANEAQPCDGETVKAVADWAGVEGKLVSWDEELDGQWGLIAAAACKVMPNTPDTTIVAIAFDINHSGAPPLGGYEDLLQVIALVEAGKVIAANRAIFEQAINMIVGSNSYRIDTARYVLSGDVRAFGIVFDPFSPNEKCPDPIYGKNLTLWIREGENLRAVFETHLHGWGTIDAWSCRGQGLGKGEGWEESAKLTLSVEKTSSHGFADLAITAHVTRELCVDHEDCSVTEKHTARKIVKYDGKSYGSEYSSRFWWPHEVLQRGKTEAQ
ncbi:MAG: hypothetical protein LBQ75_07525 [Zoogloeaceae bacterium]|jgi:hypothetical protein|nr:hypothetical protein [Zoogloeaceae bacterium]